MAWSLWGFWKKSPTTVEDAAVPSVSSQPPTSSFDKDAPITVNSTSTPVEPITTAAPLDPSVGYIPDPPAIPVEDVVINVLGEPSLHSLGLGSYFTPVGWIQLLMEFLHVDFGLSWFSTIIVYTIILRTLIFPLTVKIRKHSAKMAVIGPQMTELNQKLNDAKRRGNSAEIARAMHQYMDYIRQNDIGLKSMLTPMAQIPFVACTYFAIRNMCKLPVESMFTGGVLWFKDLTVSEPLMIPVLPVASCITLYLMVERGIDLGQGTANMTHTMKWIARLSTFIALPFFWTFSSGTMVYILTSNICSFIISFIMGVPSVQKYFKIPKIDKKLIEEKKKDAKPFIAGFKESWNNLKVVNEVENREQVRRKKFEEASLAGPVKTFKTNPKEIKKEIKN